MLMCFVRGRIFGTFAISRAPELSSKTLHLTLGALGALEPIRSSNSATTFAMGSTSRSEVESATYSASVVERAISVCRRLAQTTGQLLYLIIYPVRDRAVSGESIASPGTHVPEKSESTQHSKAGSSSFYPFFSLLLIPQQTGVLGPSWPYVWVPLGPCGGGRTAFLAILEDHDDLFASILE